MIPTMFQPAALRSEEYLPWSRGRGVDVWAMILAASSGDLAGMQALVARDPGLLRCSYEYFSPLRFAVREGRLAIVEYLLDKGLSPLEEFGDTLTTMARDREYGTYCRCWKMLCETAMRLCPAGMK